MTEMMYQELGAHDYDISEDGRIVNLRPAGADIDLSYYHPEDIVPPTITPAKEAAEKLFHMLLRAAGREK